MMCTKFGISAGIIIVLVAGFTSYKLMFVDNKDIEFDQVLIATIEPDTPSEVPGSNEEVIVEIDTLDLSIDQLQKQLVALEKFESNQMSVEEFLVRGAQVNGQFIQMDEKIAQLMKPSKLLTQEGELQIADRMQTPQWQASIDNFAAETGISRYEIEQILNAE